MQKLDAIKSQIFPLTFRLFLQATQLSKIFVAIQLPRRYYNVTKGVAVKKSSNQKKEQLKAEVHEKLPPGRLFYSFLSERKFKGMH